MAYSKAAAAGPDNYRHKYIARDAYPVDSGDIILPLVWPVLCLNRQFEGATDRWSFPEAPIKTERELVEVGLEMLGVYATVVRAL